MCIHITKHSGGEQLRLNIQGVNTRAAKLVGEVEREGEDMETLNIFISRKRKKAGEQRGFVQTWGRPRLAHPGVGVPSSSVEAVLVPLVRVLWEGMTSERVTLVLLVLWLLE